MTNLAECFLSFDLDSAYSSTLVLLMASVIDNSLLAGDFQWLQRSHSILSEMQSRGNLISGFIQAQLQNLERTLTGAMLPSYNEVTNLPPDHEPSNSDQTKLLDPFDDSPLMNAGVGDADWQFSMTTTQMMEIAESLDVEGFDWSVDSMLYL